MVVDSRVAEDVCGHRALRVEAPLLRIEAEPFEVALLEQRRLGGIGLSRYVDEVAVPVRELLVERVGVDAERSCRRGCDAARIAHPPRIGVDRGGLLADRELDAGAVEDGAARGGQDDRLEVLPRGELSQRSGLDALQPGGAAEEQREAEDEERQEKPNPAVDRAPAPLTHA